MDRLVQKQTLDWSLIWLNCPGSLGVGKTSLSPKHMLCQIQWVLPLLLLWTLGPFSLDEDGLL